jgi:Ca2+-binding RTX toxin-like protein
VAAIGRRRRALCLLVALLAITASLVASASADRVRGTPRDDRLHGGARADHLLGLAGDDRLAGRGGRDQLKAGPGGDLLIGGGQFDRLLGGTGDDVIRARDGHPDQIECGGGHDRAFVDSVEDGVFDCEEVIEP